MFPCTGCCLELLPGHYKQNHALKNALEPCKKHQEPSYSVQVRGQPILVMMINAIAITQQVIASIMLKLASHTLLNSDQLLGKLSW